MHIWTQYLYGRSNSLSRAELSYLWYKVFKMYKFQVLVTGNALNNSCMFSIEATLMSELFFSPYKYGDIYHMKNNTECHLLNPSWLMNDIYSHFVCYLSITGFRHFNNALINKQTVSIVGLYSWFITMTRSSDDKFCDQSKENIINYMVMWL